VQGSSQQSASVAAAAAGAALQQRRQQPIEPPLGPGASGQHPKLTPLEQQVVELKRRHPGVLLAVEVG
jgi:DNA mismatch repair protein MSH3